jgi:hypothetical protein
MAHQQPNVHAVADLFGPTDVATPPPCATGTYMSLLGTRRPTLDMLAAISPFLSITGRSSRTVDTGWIGYTGGHGYHGLEGKAIQLKIAKWATTQLYR